MFLVAMLVSTLEAVGSQVPACRITCGRVSRTGTPPTLGDCHLVRQRALEFDVPSPPYMTSNRPLLALLKSGFLCTCSRDWWPQTVPRLPQRSHGWLFSTYPIMWTFKTPGDSEQSKSGIHEPLIPVDVDRIKQSILFISIKMHRNIASCQRWPV